MPFFYRLFSFYKSSIVSIKPEKLSISLNPAVVIKIHKVPTKQATFRNDAFELLINRRFVFATIPKTHHDVEIKRLKPSTTAESDQKQLQAID